MGWALPQEAADVRKSRLALKTMTPRILVTDLGMQTGTSHKLHLLEIARVE
jgi:hypothetical protein